MEYNIKKIKEIFDKFKNGIELNPKDEEESVLVALFSIGRDNFSANGSIMYDLTSSEFERIHIKHLSDLPATDPKPELLRHARGVNDIISQIIANITEAEKDGFRRKTREIQWKNINEGIDILSEFPEYTRKLQ